MDPLKILPTELFEYILCAIQKEDLENVITVSKSWKNFIEKDWVIWKYHCREFDQFLSIDEKHYCSWKDIFLKNYYKYEIVSRWRKRNHSNNEYFIKNTDELICPVDVETWGYILDLSCNV